MCIRDREYPACGALIHRAAMILDGAWFIKGSCSGEREAYADEILSLYERAAECGDEEDVYKRQPYNKPYAVSLDPGYDLLPITRSYYYDMTSVPKFTGTEESKVRVEHGLQETKISAQGVVAFTPKYFSLVKKSPNTEHQGLTGNVTLFDEMCIRDRR